MGRSERRAGSPDTVLEMSLDLTGRVTVVIGATSGLGQALALGLASHGATVIPTGRRAKEFATDVTSRASLDALRDSVVGRFGKIDVLVNAASFTFREPTATLAEDKWKSLFDTNLTGTLRACQSFYEPLK